MVNLEKGNNSVTVVILTRDHDLGYFKKTFPSVLSQTHKAEQIIVVINGGSADTAGFLKNYNLNLEIITNNWNLGFAKAMNLGIKKARSDYILLLVSDIMLEPDCLMIFLHYIKNENNAGLLSGYLYDYSGKQLIFSGNKVTLGWNFKQTKMKESIRPNHTDLIIGGLVFSKTSLLKEFKGFDERYFFYFEDLDLALRFREKGFRNLIIPEVRAYHLEGAPGIEKYEFDNKIKFELEKNLLIIYFKHANLFWLLLFFARYMTYSFIKNIFDKKKNMIILKTRAWAACNLIDLIKARYCASYADVV